MSQNGKGDTPRPVDPEKYGRNYERIFGEKCWDCGGPTMVAGTQCQRCLDRTARMKRDFARASVTNPRRG